MVGPTTLHEGQAEVVKKASRGIDAVVVRERYVEKVSGLRTLRMVETFSR